jgi:fatty-acid desaturase
LSGGRSSEEIVLLLELAGLTVLVGFIGAGLAGITITVVLHRGLTHSAIRMSRPLYEIGRWMTWFTTFMRHWDWRRVHRKHHVYTDVWIDEVRHDPHSPVIISQREGIDGFRRVSWHMAAIFHAEAQAPDIGDGTYDTPADRP